MLLLLACVSDKLHPDASRDTATIVDSSADTDPDTDSDTDPDTDADTDTHAESHTDSGPGTGPDTHVDSPVDTGADSGSENTPPGDPVVDTGTWPAPTSCAVAAWSWGADNALETAETTFVGEDVGDYAGGYLTNAGDMNGDGRDDLAIGAPFRPQAATLSGKVYLLVGSGPRARSQSLAGRPSVIGDQAYMELSMTFPLGDVDGDGLADLGIRPGFQITNPPGGQYLVRGRATGWTSSLPAASCDASTTNDRDTDGSSDVATYGPFGDMDGDGLDDWFMWTPSVDDGESYVISGAGASGLLTLPGDALLWLVEAGTPAFGDLDGDGLTDIVGPASTGHTLQFIYGSAAPPYDTTVAASTAASLADAHPFGYEVIQDISGDGVSELAITVSNDGMYVFLGGRRLSGSVTLADADVHIAAGESVQDPQWLGDINGDGIDDLGFLEASASPLTELYVLFGRTAWAARIPLRGADVHVHRTSDMTEWMYGPKPDEVGDIDGDGITDLLLTSPYADTNGVESSGTIYLFRGRTSWTSDVSVEDADARFSGGVPYESLGHESGFIVADYDGDGCDDIIASSYYRPESASSTGETFVLYGQH